MTNSNKTIHNSCEITLTSKKGTSAGAIVASALCSGVSPSETVSLYEQGKRPFFLSLTGTLKRWEKSFLKKLAEEYSV
jgi:patatin-like phospholipase/acyl hydrolase